MARKTFRKIIVTDKILKDINEENKSLVSRFLREKSPRVSPTTIVNYKNCANIFFAWNFLHNENKSFAKIKKFEFSEFFYFGSDNLGWGSSRSNGFRSFLSSLSQFIEKFLDEEYPEFKNIILKTIESYPKEARREKTILSNEQVEELLKHFAKKNSQVACWLALASFSGARFSETVEFTMDLIDTENTAFGDIFLETTRQIKTKGRGKDGKKIYKYILKDRFMPYYNAWVKDRETLLKEKGVDHDYLFVKKDGSPAIASTIRSWVKGVDNFLGIDFYPHALRHFIVTEFTRKKIPANLIKDIVGWSSLEMVSVYNDLSSKDMEWDELENLK